MLETGNLVTHREESAISLGKKLGWTLSKEVPPLWGHHQVSFAGLNLDDVIK